ncbi:Protein ApaG [Polaribacter huanghezhanensis]|uniref:Co2+/Mg2+ efflux protein ApaG n=1 Tax=Polaribacter huanghezhanensis TaxID=1354726 RepID=UPI00264947D9|nr:Co2+/Mg2+ efflux protein ApaG [Polaribacter huanghezhanensis]WKD85118.1 Protein ApaG [Polaribacter huanghezhanensis]
MVQQITNGIKISVKTAFNGVINKGLNSFNAFSYVINIENESSDIVQLLERFWEISDALNDKEFVVGEGVVGQQPILNPNEQYTYQSNCFLLGDSGSMKGTFKMINKKTNTFFQVIIPTFQLSTSSLLN